ncbi:MAG: Gfo/Idh/MocA family oxidoreductase [Flavobacteriales bacterium]|nr:Gfo/Idh/MocA family oxidoreductase [Flavobacteriales bacterium]
MEENEKQKRSLKIGVLGAGHLGRIHIQQIQEIPEWDLIGFHDPHPAKCAAIHAEFGVPVYDSIDELYAAVEVVDVVTPTLSHFDLAMKAMAKGKHVFIEKPVANSVVEARTIVERSMKTGLHVQVGHVERFNPAFLAALPFFSSPMFIETHRLAQFNPRGTDVSVVLDLMIHDIDIILHVVKSDVEQVHASGVAVVSDTPDIANARIEFKNGCVANLTASRISMKNMRKSRFFQRDAYISVDMLTKETEIVRMNVVKGEPDPFAITVALGEGKGVREISFEKPEIAVTNAIREELRSFAQSISSNTTPRVPAADGAAALEIAHRVLEGMTVQKA